MVRAASVLFFAPAALALPGFSPLHRASDRRDVVPGRYLVKVDQLPGETSDAVKERIFGLTRSFGAFSEEAPREVPALGIVGMTLSAAELEAVRNDPTVAYVEEVQIYHTYARQAQSWGIDRINQVALPLDNDATFGSDGTSVDVYVIDTGILTEHTQFGGRAKQVFTAVDGEEGDGNGHGTHCAGTVGSKDYGVATNVNLYAVKVLSNSGSGSNEGVINGMNYVAQNKRPGVPTVASMSLGGGFSKAVNDAVKNMHDAGVVVVVAAGNDNKDACSYSPASAPEAITVAASEKTDTKASYSNYGKCVDIIAPGSAITSTWNDGNTKTISGTSMACPHVAGVAALYLAQNPSASPSQVASALVFNALSGKITGFDSATPNKLLFANSGSQPTKTTAIPTRTTTKAPTTHDTLTPTTTNTAAPITTTRPATTTVTPSTTSTCGCKAIDDRVTDAWCVRLNGCYYFPEYCARMC